MKEFTVYIVTLLDLNTNETYTEDFESLQELNEKVDEWLKIFTTIDQPAENIYHCVKKIETGGWFSNAVEEHYKIIMTTVTRPVKIQTMFITGDSIGVHDVV